MFRHDSQFDCETFRLLTAQKAVSQLKIDKDLTSEVIFEGDKVKEEYIDRYDGIHAEISQATRFDESTDLSKTYLGKTDMTRDQIIKAEEKFPICKDSLMQNWFKLFQLTSFCSQTWLLLLVCQGKVFPCNLDNFDILYNILNNYYDDILSIDIP